MKVIIICKGDKTFGPPCQGSQSRYESTILIQVTLLLRCAGTHTHTHTHALSLSLTHDLPVLNPNCL